MIVDVLSLCVSIIALGFSVATPIIISVSILIKHITHSSCCGLKIYVEPNHELKEVVHETV